MSSTEEIKETEVDKAVSTRHSCNKFSDKPLDMNLLGYVLRLTQRTPTAFNLQNYRILVARNKDVISKIREAQAAANVEKSLNAVPVIFMSDLQPSDSLPNFSKLCKKGDVDEEFVNTVKDFLGYFVKQNWYDGYKTPIAGIVKNKLNLPPAVDSQTYGEKTIGLVVGTFVALCTSHGIDTHIMESFADWKVQKILNIPSRFHPSVIVWCGYRAEDPKKLSLRYDSEDMIFEDNFGKPFKQH